MTYTSRVLGLLCISAALVLSACGGGETATSDSVAQETTPSPTPTTSQDDYTLLSDLKYGQGATTTGSIDLLLDIYHPEAACTAPRPTVFYVHGGGFIMGDKADSIVAVLAPRITAAGFNFVSINYRLAGDAPVLSPDFTAVGQAYADEGLLDPGNALFNAILASFEDGVTALNWMEANAGTYCLDMNRLGYWGSSAGTFVTLQIAYALDRFNIQRPEPRFVNAWWGVLLRDEDLEAGEAPLLLLHGDQDSVVPYQESVDLAARADAVNVPYAFYTLEGAGHGFDLDTEAQTRAAIDASVEFAVDQLTGGNPVYGRFSVPQ